MAKDKEDIKAILDEYRRFHKDELSSSALTNRKFKTIYNEFMEGREEVLNHTSNTFFYFIHKLNKLAKDKKVYCGVNMASFAKKIQAKHSYSNPFDIHLLKKNSEGLFVMERKTKDGCELVPVERTQLSVFTAFVQFYLDAELFDNNLLT